MAKKIIMYSTSWCPDCRAAKKFLQSKGIEYEEVDIEKHPEGAGVVMKLNNGMKVVPTLDIEGEVVIGDNFNPVQFEKDLAAAGVL
jgi:mycoredoxin